LIGPLLLAAKNNDSPRFAFSAPQAGQTIGASASFIARRASKRAPQAWQLYS